LPCTAFFPLYFHASSSTAAANCDAMEKVRKQRERERERENVLEEKRKYMPP
jgi:hypothetical protein